MKSRLRTFLIIFVALGTLGALTSPTLASNVHSVIATNVSGGTISVSPSDPVVGEDLTVTGDFAGISAPRAVWLQHQNSDGDWLTDDEGMTTAAGDYAFTTPAVDGQTIRAYVPPDTSDPSDDGTASPTKTISATAPAGTLTITGTGTSTANAVIDFLPRRAQAYTLEYSNDRGVTYTSLKTGTLSASAATPISLTGLPAYGRKYRATTQYPGAPSKAVSNIVSFTPTPSTVSHRLPVVRINTAGGISISSRTTYRDMTMTIDSGDPAHPAITSPDVRSSYASPTFMGDQIKGRGNYSWSFPKKSYKIKLDSKADLLGMGKSKHWVLLANWYDKSSLRTSVASKLSDAIFADIPYGWTPKYRNVEVVLNGVYNGTYQLIEHVRVQGGDGKSESDRVKIPTISDTATGLSTSPNVASNPLSGGYLLEWDFRKATPYFHVSAGYIDIDDPAPDPNNPSEAAYANSQAFKDQKAWITKYVTDTNTQVYQSVNSANWDDIKQYLDVNSVVDWWMVNEAMKTVDGQLYASAFMYKAPGGKLTFGPAWDFDLSAGNVTRSGNTVGNTGWYLRDSNAATARQVTTTWINQLFKYSQFRALVSARWNAVYGSGLGQFNSSTIGTFIDSQRDQIATAAAANAKKWPPTQRISKYSVLWGSWPSEVSHLRSWVTGRLNWMNSKL